MPESANKLAISQLIRLLFPNLKDRFKVYSYWQDFDELWDTADEQQHFIVVIWDCRPVGDPNLSSYLSPIDWAIWKTLSNTRNDDCRIVIFDVASYSEANAPGIQLFKLLGVNKSVFGEQIKLIPLKPEELTWGIHRLISFAGSSSSEGETLRSNNALIKQFWRSIFLNPESPEDNHSLSNALGPSLISKEVASNPSIAAISKLLAHLDLMPDSTQYEVPWFDWSKPKWKKRINRIRRSGGSALKLLVVDDKAAKFGWLKIVASKLGFHLREHALGERSFPVLAAEGMVDNLPCELYFTSSANAFIDSVSSIERFQFQIAVEDLSNQRSRVVEIDMLLLDMRLFEGREKTEELDFFRRLVSLFSNQGTSNAMWPTNLHQEFKTVSDWLDGDTLNRYGKMYLKATLLLSKLIATRDGSLPIVFFSSTDRKVVADEMRKFGSVILDFKKPKIQVGVASELYSSTRSGFISAFTKALDFVIARRSCQALMNPVRMPELATLRSKLPSKKTGKWRVLIAIDESGDIFRGSRMTVGGIMGIFPPGENPVEFDQWVHAKLPRLFRYKKDDWRREFETILNAILKESNVRQILWMPISLTGVKPDQTTVSDQEGESSWLEKISDEFHRLMLKQLLEYSIFCIARLLLYDKAKSCSISALLPTRSIPLQLLASHSKMDPRSLQDDLFDQLGIECGYAEEEAKAVSQLEHATNALSACISSSLKDEIHSLIKQVKVRHKKSFKKRAFFLEPKDALPMVQEVAAFYNDSSFEVQLETVRAFRINRFSHQSEASLNHVIHYLVDKWVGIKSLEELSIEKVRRFGATSVEAESGDLFSSLLKANRYLANGLTVLALVELQAVMPIFEQRLKQYWPSFRHVANAISKLDGTEFLSFARILAQSQD